STLRDFVTTFQPYFDVATLSDGRKTFGFIYNFRGQASLETIFPTPKIDPVVSAIIGDTETKKQTQALSNGDDYLLAVSYNAATRLFGRNADRHRVLFDELLRESINDPSIALDKTFAEAASDPAAFESSLRGALPAGVAKLTSDFTPR